MRTEQELLVDCLRRLNDARLEYMLTGSMASNFWGIPRTTHDLDFVVHLLPHQVLAMVGAFEQGFFIQEASVRSAFRPPFQFNALDDLSALKVDFWLLRDEHFEREMFRRRKQVDLFSTRAWIATAEDVVLHKLYWHGLSPSDRQLGDAAGIHFVQGVALDVDYLEKWAKILNVVETLKAVLDGRIRPKST